MQITAKQIQAKITKAVKATINSRDAIQEALFLTIQHAYLHGDVSLLNRLFSELPSGVQREKLQQYILATAPIRMNKAVMREEKGLFSFKLIKDEAECKEKQDMLANVAWYDYRPANSNGPKVDVTTASIFSNTLKSMVKRLQEHTDLNEAEIRALKALEEAVNSRKA